MTLNALALWKWTPCAQKNGSCTDVGSGETGLRAYELQAVVTHELGHWLGLADLASSRAAGLTMYERVKPGQRQQATLGLGDIKGLRHAYPCGPCRIPRIATP